MKKIFLLLLLLPVVVTTNSAQQFSRDFWHNGEIDMRSGETVKGRIKYNLEANSLLVQLENGSMRTYNPRSVEAWQILDAQSGEDRIFYSLNFAEDGSKTGRAVFFELLTDGESLILFTRRKVETEIDNVYDPFWVGGRAISVQVERENYYLLDRRGNMAAIDNNARDFLKLANMDDEQVKEYIKRNRLRLEFREDMTNLINYYNAVISQ